MKDTVQRAREKGRGREANSPHRMPPRAWKDILRRVYTEVNDDRIMLIAAGATFYLLLALFPALTAFVSLYGFVADPVTIADQIAYLGGMLPSGGLEIIRDQLNALVSQDQKALSIGFVIAFLAALWSTNTGVKALFDALNVAYEENEKRGFIKLNLLSMSFTLLALFAGILLIVTVGIVPVILSFLRLEDSTELLVQVLRWPLIVLVIATAIAMLYRYGPSREHAKWRWISWGGIFATIVWLIASSGFSYYLQNFADYNATYGSLGAIIGFMVWTWISVVIVLVGAELNAEIEHQTARDTTTGDPAPLGERGATMADMVGASTAEVEQK